MSLRGGGWRYLLLGVILGLLTVSIVVAITPLEWSFGASASIERPGAQRERSCPADEHNCVNSPHAFVKKYKAGRWGRVRRNKYSSGARTVILRKAQNRWEATHKRHQPWPGDGVMWRNFIGSDTCVARGINNMVTACVPGQAQDDVVCHNAKNTDPSDNIGVCVWPSAPEWWQRNLDRIVFCGLTLVPAVFTGGASTVARLVFAGYGGSTCFSQFFID